MVDAFQVVVGLKVTFQAVTMAFVAWRCPLSRTERDRLVTILMVTGAICATWGIIQQALGPDALRDMGYRYNSTIRFSGSFMRSFSTFVQPFPFAFFLMIVVLVGIPIALHDPIRLRNRVFLLLLPIYGIGMLVAVVRGAWIGTAVGLLYLGVRRHRILLLGIPVAVIVLLLGPSTSGSNATKTTSGQTRLTAWNDNFYAIGDHPLGRGHRLGRCRRGEAQRPRGRRPGIPVRGHRRRHRVPARQPVLPVRARPRPGRALVLPARPLRGVQDRVEDQRPHRQGTTLPSRWAPAR